MIRICWFRFGGGNEWELPVNQCVSCKRGPCSCRVVPPLRALQLFRSPEMGKFDVLDNDTQVNFIKTLRSFPCLWDEKSEAYKSPKKREHKAQRDLAFEVLLSVLKKNDHYKDATTETVKDLLKALFSSFKTQRINITINRNYPMKYWYPLLTDFLPSRSEESRSLTPTEILLDDEDDNHVNQFLQVKLEECPDSSEVDYGYPTNLIQNRPDDGSRNSSPLPSNNIVCVPDTSTDNVPSSPEPKRRKLGSSSSTCTSSIDKDFGNYVMIALSKMDEDQRVKAEGKITEILRQGRNGRL